MSEKIDYFVEVGRWALGGNVACRRKFPSKGMFSERKDHRLRSILGTDLRRIRLRVPQEYAIMSNEKSTPVQPQQAAENPKPDQKAGQNPKPAQPQQADQAAPKPAMPS